MDQTPKWISSWSSSHISKSGMGTDWREEWAKTMLSVVDKKKNELKTVQKEIDILNARSVKLKNEIERMQEIQRPSTTTVFNFVSFWFLLILNQISFLKLPFRNEFFEKTNDFKRMKVIDIMHNVFLFFPLLLFAENPRFLLFLIDTKENTRPCGLSQYVEGTVFYQKYEEKKEEIALCSQLGFVFEEKEWHNSTIGSEPTWKE